MADQDFDLLVIGAGPGGYVAAIRAGQLGLKTAVVEKDQRLGGTCLLRGCIPTKQLLHTADLLEQIREAGGQGIEVGEARVDMDRAMDRKEEVVAKNARGVEFLFKKNKVVSLHGHGRLTGANEVEVTPPEGEGGTKTYRAKHVLIATGSVPREIPIAQADGERIVNSDHILQLGHVPASLAVLGGGAVGTEFASMFTSFGSKVTVIEMLDRLLPVEDEEVSKELQKAFRKRGIEARTGTKLAGVERTDSGVKLSFDGSDETVEAEMLLVAVGRGPYTEGLGLESVGLETDRGYLEVDGYLRTGAEGVYAIGDVVTAPPWLAHKASAEGIVAVEHMAGHETRPLDYKRVPSVVFTDPEVGSVGLTEAAAREAGYEVAVGKFPFAAIGKAKIEGKSAGFFKIVRDTKYDEVLGVHIIGVHATDLIAEACAALQLEATAEELFRAVHAHPTLAEGMAEAAHASHGAAIHF